MRERQVAALMEEVPRTFPKRRQVRILATAGAWIAVFLAILAVPAPPKNGSIDIDAVSSASDAAATDHDRKDRAADHATAKLVRDRLAFPWMMNAAAREKAVRTGSGRIERSARSPAQAGVRTSINETFLPLKLSDEQRRVSRFVSGRYRVKPENAQRYVAYAFRSADEFQLDPYLVLAVMSVESGINAKARSSAGAQGLMQILTRVHQDKFEAFGGAEAAFDPVANVAVGARILKEYLLREGSVEGALKSYVGAALLAHDYGYGKKVLAERRRIVAAARGIPTARAMTTRHDDVIRLAMSEFGVRADAKVAVIAEKSQTHID